MNDDAWVRWLAGKIQPGMVCLDIGANEGWFSTMLGRAVGPKGRVIACEPYPDTAEQLRQRVQGLPVEVFQIALSDRNGTATLHCSKDDSKQHSLFRSAIVHPHEDITARVQTMTLDTLCADADLQHVDFVKVDAQGAEALILAGAADLLASPATAWMLELWPYGLQQAGSSMEAVIDLLAHAGLEPFGLDTDNRRVDGPWRALLEVAATKKPWSAMNVGCARPSLAWCQDAVLVGEG